MAKAARKGAKTASKKILVTRERLDGPLEQNQYDDGFRKGGKPPEKGWQTALKSRFTALMPAAPPT